MSRSFIAGMTDYSHQSITDLKEDLTYWMIACKEKFTWINTEISKIESYWTNVPLDFVNEIEYSRKFFQTVSDEIEDILPQLDTEVLSNHITRLNSLAKTADKENRSIGQVWHEDSMECWKDYKDPDFRIVERIYGHTRDLVTSLRDLSNIASRLNDYVGKMKGNNTADLSSTNFGNNAVISIGNNNVVNVNNSITITPKNFMELKRELLKNGITEKNATELEDIITKDTPDYNNKTFGEGVSSWIGKMVSLAALNIWNISIGAAGSLLAELLNQYYGWI